PTGKPTTISVQGLRLDTSDGCPFPVRVASFETSTLVALLSEGDHPVVRQAFPARYQFAGEASSPTATTPVIEDLSFGARTTGYPDAFFCGVREGDGDDLTVTLSVQSEGGRCRPDQHQCWSVTKTFGRRL